MDEQRVFIRDSEADVLNTARDVLAAIAGRARGDHSTQGSGIIFAAATHAEDAIFDVLNFTRSYGGQKIADNVLHNRHEATSQERSAV